MHLCKRGGQRMDRGTARQVVPWRATLDSSTRYQLLEASLVAGCKRIKRPHGRLRAVLAV